MSQFSFGDVWPLTMGMDECAYFCSRCSWAVWPQRLELCGSGTFLKFAPLQDFLLQIRTLTSLICLSLVASLWWATDFTCRAILLLSLNYILQTLEISARRGERVTVSGERNCVVGSCFKKLGARVVFSQTWLPHSNDRAFRHHFQRNLHWCALCSDSYCREICTKCFSLKKNPSPVLAVYHVFAEDSGILMMSGFC